MNFEKFRQNLLSSCQSANYVEFLKLIDNHPEFSTRWMELCHSKSGDTIAHVAAMSGSVEILKYCHENHAFLLTSENSDRKVPLHVAAQYEQLLTAQFLLTCHLPVDPLKRGDWTPLMLACTKNNIKMIQLLIDGGADPSLANKDGWNAFHIACREGHDDIISYILDKYSMIWKTKSKNGRTPLHTAALHGCYEAVKVLVSRCGYGGADIDTCGSTPLMDAAMANHVPIMKLLITEQKASVFDVDFLGRNVLHLAAQAGSTDAIEFLVTECKVNVNSKSYGGHTALHFAATDSQVLAMKCLLSYGANPNITDNRGRTAL